MKRAWCAANAGVRPVFWGDINADAPDARLSAADLLLAPLAAIATTPTPRRGGRKEYVLTLRFPSASDHTTDTVWEAVRAKYFRSPDCRKPKNARAIARKLVIGILANKPKWSRYDSAIAALLVDQNFVGRLAHGLERKRKPIFDDNESVLLLNWHRWSSPRASAFKKQNVPPLKFWTREAICKLLQADSDEAFELSRLDSRLRRLALDKQAIKPATVIFCEYFDGMFRIEDVTSN